MAFSLASLFTSGLGGYQQGQAQGYSRLAALNQFRLAQQRQQALDEYHMGQVMNGQVRNQNAYDANFGDPNNPGVQGRLQTAGQLAQARSLAITGGVDANGNIVQGSAANGDMRAQAALTQAQNGQINALANGSDYLAANPASAPALGIGAGVTFNPSALSQAKVAGLNASAGLATANAAKTNAQILQIPANSQSQRALQAAQAGMDTALGSAATSGAQTKQFTAQQQAQYNSRMVQLKQQGLNNDQANAQARIEISRGQLAVSQGNLALSTQRYMNPNTPGAGKTLLPSGMTFAQDQSLDKQSHAQELQAAQLADSVQSGKASDGTPLNAGQIAARQHLIQSLQQSNAQINARRNSLAPAPVQAIRGVGGAVQGIVAPSASLGALPTGVTPLPALPAYTSHPSASQPRHPVTGQFQPRPASGGKLDFSKFRP